MAAAADGNWRRLVTYRYPTHGYGMVAAVDGLPRLSGCGYLIFSVTALKLVRRAHS